MPEKHYLKVSLASKSKGRKLKNLRNKSLKALALSASILLPLTANAVERSEGQMPQELYKDYYVHLLINTLEFGRPVVTSCGGTLVNGEYVITAHHCVQAVDDHKVTIMQGLDSSNPDAIYEGVGYEVRAANTPLGVCRTREVAIEIYQNHVEDRYINELGRDVVDAHGPHIQPRDLPSCYEWAEGFNEPNNVNLFNDIAILKLDRVIPHQDAPVLAKTFDVDGEALAIGEEVVFYGRGVLADGTTPGVPQKASLYRESSRFWPVQFRETDELDSMGDWLRVEEPCSTDPEVMNDRNYHCLYLAHWAELYFNPTNSVTSGDSGSPLEHNGYVYGLVSGQSNWNQENTHRRSRFTSFSYLEEWLKEEIAGLAYPSKLVMDATQNATLDIAVQNFTNEVVMPDVYQGDVMTGLTITQACSSELAPFESCTVSLEVNAELLALEEDLEVVIPFTQSEQFVVTLQGPVEVPEVEDLGEGDSEADESEVDVTESEETETDVTESEESEVDVTESEETETDVTESEESEVDVTESEEAETDVTESEESEADVTESEEAETDVTESEETETDVTESEETETDVTESEESEADVTGSEETETDVTGSVESETDVTGSVESESDDSDTDTGNPGSGQVDQEADQSETDSTETDGSVTEEKETDVTETDQTETEQSEETEVTTPKSGKSGGSAGWLVLLALACLARYRQRS